MEDFSGLQERSHVSVALLLTLRLQQCTGSEAGVQLQAPKTEQQMRQRGSTNNGHVLNMSVHNLPCFVLETRHLSHLDKTLLINQFRVANRCVLRHAVLGFSPNSLSCPKHPSCDPQQQQ